MNLQKKTLLVLVLSFIAVIAFISIFVSGILLDGYSNLEKNYVEKDLLQAQNKLQENTGSLSLIVSDWGQWDDSYDFVNGNKPDYISINLVPETYENLLVNYIIFTSRDGKIVYSGAYDPQTHSVIPVPEALLEQINKDNPLLFDVSDPGRDTAGILMLSGKPLLIASHPIVHTDFSGTPQGVVIMGRLLDQNVLDRLTPGDQVSITMVPITDPSLPADLVKKMQAEHDGDPDFILPVNISYVAGYAVIHDIYGSDAFVIETIQPRDIYSQGVTSTIQYIVIILGAFAVLGVAVLLMIDQFVLSRVGSLSRQVRALGPLHEIDQKIVLSGDDELSGLATDIDRMLEKIRVTRGELVKSRERFQDIAELLPQIVFEMDMSGRLTFLNRSGLEMAHETLENFARGLYAHDFFLPTDRQRLAENLDRITKKRETVEATYTFARHDGSMFLGDTFVSAIIHNNEVIGYRGIIIDITEQKKITDALAESENNYRTLTESVSDVLFSTNLKGVITYISSVCNRYGFLAEEVVSRPVLQFVHPEDQEKVRMCFVEEIPKGKPIDISCRIVDKWGYTHWVEAKCMIRVNINGQVTGINGVMRDFTDRRRAENAIMLANKKLNLLNNITRHDSLNTITGLFGLVDMANASTVPEERKELLDQIRELTGVIQRQIAFTREYQSVGVNAPAWQNLLLISKRAIADFPAKNIRFVNEIKNIEIYADPLLEKVFYNLIDNAIRYGEHLTTIRFYNEISDKGLTLVCEDDGVGIPDKEKESIFERGIGKNTGMGLFLAREILLITEITIQETGKPGYGAKFEILVPNGAFRIARDNPDENRKNKHM